MDILLVCMGVQLLSLFTDYAWYVLYVIPAFAAFLVAKMGYELVFGGGVMGLLGLGGAGGAGGKVPMPDLPKKKKREEMTAAERKKDDLKKKRRERKDRKQGMVRQRV